MKKKFLLVFACLFVFVLLRAQQEELDKILLSEEHTAARIPAMNAPNQIYEFAMEYPEVEGKPYLTKEQLYGKLFLADGSVLEDISFKYNIYEDAVEVLLKGKRINLDAEQVMGFSFVDEEKGERIFRNGYKIDVFSEETGLTNLSYFEVLYEGQYVVVLRHWSREVKKSSNTTKVPGMGQAAIWHYFSDPKEAAFLIKEGYFLPVKLNKVGFYRVFSDAENQVRTYIKRNWLRCKTTEELAKVAAYYDRLLIRRAEREREKQD